MSTLLFARSLTREGLTNQFVTAGQMDLAERQVGDLISERIPSRGGIVGKWSRDADPFPDILVVNDDDLSDTHAWLSSFFAPLSPISQWCRIVPQSALGRLADRRERPFLDRRLGGWIGAILAECSVQSLQSVNLKELPGSASLATATFAAARGIAVWGDLFHLRELAERYEELGSKLRENTRVISATQLLPIWHTLNGHFDPLERNSERKALEPFVTLLEKILLQGNTSADAVSEVVRYSLDSFGLPTIAECSRGPQLDRVRALDVLAQDLAREQRTASTEALLGFAASLIDPGMAVIPELLRKVSNRFPLAPIWLGVFAGCWSPMRVFTDYSGLGRLVTKALLADADLAEKPQCDISYDEVSRWLNGVTASKLPLRGMTARGMSVEISLGVTCLFPVGRETTRNEAPIAASRREETVGIDQSRSRTAAAPSQVGFLSRAVDVLTQRVDELEKYVADDREMKRKLAAEQSEPDLLSPLRQTGDRTTKKK